MDTSKLKKQIDNQELIWDKYLTGSQIHNLFSPFTRFKLLLAKKGLTKKVIFKGNQHTKHGNKCEKNIGIPYLEKEFSCPNDVNRSIMLEEFKLSGNCDFYNYEKNILCEIKTTAYDHNADFDKQTETLKHGVSQLAFYRYLINVINGKRPVSYLFVIVNNKKCIKEDTCQHDVIGINIDTWAEKDPEVASLVNLDYYQLCQAFWTDYDKFESENNKIKTQSELLLSDYNAKDNILKAIKNDLKNIETTANLPYKENIKELKSKLKIAKQDISEIKDLILKKQTFYYSYSQKEILYKYLLLVKPFFKTMFGVRKI